MNSKKPPSNTHVETTTVSRIVQEIQRDFDDGFQILDVISITANIVKLLQLERQLRGKGEIKKKLALVIFRQLVDESVLSDSDILLMVNFIKNDLPDLIDTFKSLGQTIAREWRRSKCFGCLPKF